jgi:hypothetical protein
LFAVQFVIQREFEFNEDGTTTETETVLMQTVLAARVGRKRFL